MTSGVEEWRARVSSAALSGQQEELRALFTEARALFGDEASAEWARALSALDGTAVTG